ncbi:uncharacterized protein MELLADRAFT_91920 [Melampsora larici-populina 98AG31]|uniref:Uncharacterized protein n=1 Tax=Melampsora larici-populina (strain 98AG31 / pathotype 3-4-7) TaxID=747676 RepID=F4S0V7_MELLP|nr:uncharacterized protein MELLADRAFT_91920 [Melampsora larici-populina 98AG31]EGG01744.1 hypothetical protein MELLADRAFT_91920 [Melampsora larici-populina 98AG31]
MVSTRANRGSQSSAPPTQTTSTTTKTTTKKSKRKRTRTTKGLTTSDSEHTQDDINGNGQKEVDTRDEETEEESNRLESIAFRSRFPGFEIDKFEEKRKDWTLIALRQAIAKQNSKTSKAPQEIKSLVLSIRMEYEKRMLMAALMGGVPEIVVWNIVGKGAKKGHANPWIRFLAFCHQSLGEKLPEPGDKDGWTNRNKKSASNWKKLSKHEKDVFRDPYFFALANLPDLSNVPFADENEINEDETDLQHLEESAPTPSVHKLTDEQKSLYQPLFDKLVDIEKLQSVYGKPTPSSSVATVQKKSLAALRKAHHAQYQITYYLAAVSCGSTEGWTQVFSNNPSFANWSSKEAKVPQTLSSYIHGKSAVQTVEGSKVQQPSDERRTRLGRILNKLVECYPLVTDDVYKGGKFPKSDDPEGELKKRALPIRVVQKAGSVMSKEELEVGHRKIKDATVKSWLKDIENGNFVIERIPHSETTNSNSCQQRSSEKSTKRKQSSSNQNRSEEDDDADLNPPTNPKRSRVVIPSDDEDAEEDQNGSNQVVKSKGGANAEQGGGRQPPGSPELENRCAEMDSSFSLPNNGCGIE